MIFGKFDERSRPGERIEPKGESGKTEMRKAQPIVVEQAGHTPTD
jgi:hypothetical protein